MSDKTVELCEAEIARLRGAIRKFVDESRRDMEEAEHELRVCYAQIISGALGCLVGWAIGMWLWG